MNKSNEVIKKEVVVTEKPDEWRFGNYFGDLKWISKDEVVLISKKGSSEFKVKI